MNKKEAARIKVAMEIIRENCESSADCDGCPFDSVCGAYLHDTGKIPTDWKKFCE